ncbi:MAG: aryl-sulfate sulfotransferase [Myxococcota bacterium]
MWLTWLTWVGCGPEPSAPPTVSFGAPFEPECAPNPAVPTVLDCRWTSAASGAGWVEYWRDGEAVRSTAHGPPGTAHDLAVLGLKAGASYHVRAVVSDGEARVEGPVITHVVPDVPPEFPVLSPESVDPARSELVGGYVLTSLVLPADPPYSVVVIVDSDGDYVWWTRTDGNRLVIAPKLARDGRSVWFLATDIAWEEDVGQIYRVALDGDSASTTRALLGHHAMLENADGSLTWIGFEYRTVDGTDWAADVLRTGPEGSDGSTAPTQEFSWLDAYSVDPWVPDPNGASVSLGDGVEWTHSNSLMAIDDDSFYVMSRLLDCVIRVDRASGRIVWQLGGQYSDFTHPDGTSVWRTLRDNDLFSHAHMSDLWDGGMVVFDNGSYHAAPPRSRAVEYRWDESARTVEEVWSFDEPDGGYTGSMGDVRRLAGGNTLIAWSSLAWMNEVTPEGETVWALRMPAGAAIVGRVTPLAAPLDGLAP